MSAVREVLERKLAPLTYTPPAPYLNDLDSVLDVIAPPVEALVAALELADKAIVELTTKPTSPPTIELGGRYIHRVSYDLAEDFCKANDAANAALKPWREGACN